MAGKQSALVILSCCAALVASDASAQSSCSKIADDKERLACFDIGASVEHKAALTPQASPRRGNKELARGLRAAYANQLRRSFLSNGVSMHVSTYEKNDKKLEDAFTEYRKLYPRLVFTGYLSDSLVFQIARKGEVLKNAAALGFAGVQFISQGEGGVWLYDVSGATLPRCDVSGRVCL